MFNKKSQNPDQDSRKKNKTALGRFQFSLILLLIAVASISAATVAWFSISDNSKVQSMGMEITTGTGMRFDLDPHATFEEYIETLMFDQISGRMKSEKGFDMKKVPLDPVTSKDAKTFRTEDGANVSDRTGQYLTFTLHFMAQEDMIVHLTSENGDDKGGTLITSKNKNLPKAMRISFEADGKTYIYDPGMGNTSSGGTVKTFGLPASGSMSYNSNNAMFSLEKEKDKEVLCHVWLEGTDEACTDDIKSADYQIALKFKGTDENNKPIDEDRYEEDNNKKHSDDPKYYTKRDQTADEYEENDDTFSGKMKQFWNNIKEIFRNRNE